MPSELEIKYRDYAHILSILCNKSSNYYSKIKNIFLIALVIPSSIMAVLNGGLSESSMRIPNICINAITALLISINNSLKISEKADKFKQLSVKFYKLESEIEQFICNGTMNNDKLLTCINQYNTLLEQCDLFPEFIKNHVKKTTKRKHLPHMMNGYTDEQHMIDIVSVSPNN